MVASLLTILYLDSLVRKNKHKRKAIYTQQIVASVFLCHLGFTNERFYRQLFWIPTHLKGKALL